MIGHRISILPSISKNREKRLTLQKKQQRSLNFLRPNFEKILTNKNQPKDLQRLQNLLLPISRSTRYSSKSQNTAYNLIIQTNNLIHQKTPASRNRSLSYLLMGRELKKCSSPESKKSLRMLPRNTKILTKQALKLTGIQFEQRQSFSFYEKSINFKQLPITTDSNLCSKSQIQPQFNESKQNNQLQNIQHIEFQQNECLLDKGKKFVSIGVQTNFNSGAESYKEFMKYKITQKQKFDQLQELFKWISNVYQTQSCVFDKRFNQILKLYHAGNSTQREATAQNILKNQQKIDMEIHQLMNCSVKMLQNFKISAVEENKLHFDQIYQEINSALFFNFNNTCFIQKGKLQKEDRTHLSMNFINKLPVISEKLEELKQKANNLLENLVQHAIEQFRDILNRFVQLKEFEHQKNFMLSLCIQDILKLPELSMSIFGMQKGIDSDEQTLRKIGIYLKEIPNLNDPCKQQDTFANIQKEMEKLLDMKCFNCSYLKSKMKYIEGKNNDLKPVIKILKKLSKRAHQSIYQFIN